MAGYSPMELGCGARLHVTFEGGRSYLKFPIYNRRMFCPLIRHSIKTFLQRNYTLTLTLRTMSSMKVVQITKPGGVEALQYADAHIDHPGKDQVLVRNAYSGVNFIDTYTCSVGLN